MISFNWIQKQGKGRTIAIYLKAVNGDTIRLHWDKGLHYEIL